MKPPNFPTEKVPKNRPIRGRRAEHRQQIAFLNAPGKRSEDRSGNRALKNRSAATKSPGAATGAE